MAIHGKSSEGIRESALRMTKKKLEEGCAGCARGYASLAVQHGATRRDFMRLGLGALAVPALASLPVQAFAAASPAHRHNATQAVSCPTTTTTQNTMAIQSPCSPNVVTANQVTAGALTGVAISDQDASVVNGPLPIQVTAPGLVNVEVWTHGAMAVRLTAGANDVFTGTLDLSGEPTGPLNVSFFAWNTPPGDNSYTVALAAQLDLFVHGTPATIPFPVGASGMTLTWADDFDTLSATPCKPGTGTWPNCTAPTASDGFTWYENKPGGGDFGDAAFEHTDSPYNPYTINDSFLRIRMTYDPSYVDPYGYNRHWYSGLLATAFPDGSTNAPALQNGYYEARILSPNGSAGSNTNASGGTWPAWWMLDLQSLQGASGAVEIDTAEQYGNDPHYTQAEEHAYGDASGQGPIYQGDPGPDFTVDFHRYGMLINNGTATFYLDDSPLGSIALTTEPGIATFNWFLLLDLALGGGWPENPPPANYYDMWIDYVRYYS